MADSRSLSWPVAGRYGLDSGSTGGAGCAGAAWRGRRHFLTVSSSPGGWAVGETIRVQVRFSEPVSVSGSPRLALGIGSEIRFAGFDEEASAGAFVAFAYHIAADDRDEDGVSIGTDALELNGRTIRNGAGLDANLDLGSHVIENSAQQVVVGTPPPRECTDEQERAETHSPVLLPKWDGMPFRVDMIRNFPEFVTEEDLVQLLAPVGLLADKIERQLGYRILEMGEVIPVPRRDAASSWLLNRSRSGRGMGRW